MISKTTHEQLNIDESCDHYINNLGYTELNVSGPLGNRVFLSSCGNVIVRIGHDVGYDIFASSVMNGSLVLSNVVKIYDHCKINRSNDVFYTITEMERLDELNAQEISGLNAWRVKIEKELNQPSGLIDPYYLLSDFVTLFKFINGYSNQTLTHDYLQSKNIMKRGGEFIIIDPIA